jgi:hypothetical protein
VTRAAPMDQDAIMDGSPEDDRHQVARSKCFRMNLTGLDATPDA